MTITETSIDTIMDLRGRVTAIFDNPFSVTLFGKTEQLLADVRDNGVGKTSPKDIENHLAVAEAHMNGMAQAMTDISAQLDEVRSHAQFDMLYGNVRKRLDAGMPTEITSDLHRQLRSLKETIEFVNDNLLPRMERRAKFLKFVEAMRSGLERVRARKDYQEFLDDPNEPSEPAVDITEQSSHAELNDAKAFIDAYWEWTKSIERLTGDRRLGRMGLTGVNARVKSNHSKGSRH
jgi:hypothetical protein